MTLMQNPFEGRNEILLITYEDVIRSKTPFILKELIKYKNIYKDYIDFSKFENLNDDNLLRFSIQRTKKNILEFLALKEFDYEKQLKDLSNLYFDLYEESNILSMCENINMLLTQRFIDKIYIFTEEYDIRVHIDIEVLFNSDKVIYVTGNFKDTIKIINGVTNFFINDIDYLLDIMDSGLYEYTNISMASYGYNYVEVDDKLELRLDALNIIGDSICKFATFMPIRFEKKHFNQI